MKINLFSLSFFFFYWNLIKIFKGILTQLTMKKSVLIIVFFLFNSNVFCQVTGASALLFLNELDDRIKEQIQSIDNLLTTKIGQAGNAILSINDALRVSINETIGNTDQRLRENQLNIYNSILNLSDDFNKLLEGNLNKVDEISIRVTETLDNFIVKKKEPRIYTFDTPQFIKGHNGYYLFKIRGKNFDQSEIVKISINEKFINPIQVTYNEITFKIDSSDIKPVSNNIFFALSDINFNWRKGLFRKRLEKSTPFIIPVFPLNIGEAVVHFEQALPERKYGNPITFTCENCTTGATSAFGNRRKSSRAFSINPTGGRKLDPETIKITNWSQRYGGNYTFHTRNENLISGEIDCQSEAKPAGGGGFSTLTFTYQEYEIIYPIKKMNTSLKTLTTINPTIFGLPQAVDGKRPNVNYIVVKTFDNKEIIVSPNSQNNFFKLSINPATNDVLVSWKGSSF